MSLSPSLSADLAASITRMADKRITGQEDSDEEEDEDEDEDEGDDDEAEHSDDGGSDELEGSDKSDSDEVEDSDESDGGEDDHVCIGVFNPRHSRGESTFKVRVERRAGGTTLIPIINGRR